MITPIRLEKFMEIRLFKTDANQMGKNLWKSGDLILMIRVIGLGKIS